MRKQANQSVQFTKRRVTHTACFAAINLLQASALKLEKEANIKISFAVLNLLQASALSSQLYELKVVSEKRLVAAAAEGRAALQAERLELQVCWQCVVSW